MGALAVAATAPEETKPILIVKQAQNHDTEKQVYSFIYETENGISVSESESRSRSEPRLMKPEPSPRANTLTPKKARPTPSPGSPMRTVSRPPGTICPLLYLCPNMSSSSSKT